MVMARASLSTFGSSTLINRTVLIVNLLVIQPPHLIDMDILMIGKRKRLMKKKEKVKKVRSKRKMRKR